ncbi:MAG: NDP-sugar synthase [Victivallaceae bacterium]|nr:NDP-sugar synthase [Victivallaceae bacterium]
MKCLIHCCRKGTHWVRQYFSDAEPYMLRIGNKPLLEFYIEFCALNGIKDIYIAEKGFSHEIREHFGDGAKWDVCVNYLPLNEDDKIQKIIRSNQTVFKKDNLLVFQGFFFLQYKKSHLSETFLPEDRLWQNANESGEGIFLLKPPFSFRKKDFESFSGNYSLQAREIDSIKTYFDLNMDMVSGAAKNYIMPSYSNEAGVFIGQNVEIMYGCEITKPVILGDDIQLKRRSSIGPGVIIGNNSLIDSDTTVQNAVICRDSYIGTKLEIINKIIYRRRIIDPDSGAMIHIVDDFLLAEVGSDLITSVMSRFVEFLLIVLLVCVQLPLYILLRPWVKCTYKKIPIWKDKNGIRKVSLKRFISQSDRGANKLFIKLSLHKFHLIPLCMNRTLRLIGNAPQPATAEALYNVRELSNYRPAVFSLSDMYGEVQSDEKRQVNELFYSKHETIGLNVSIFFRTLIFNFFGTVHGKKK